MVGKMDSVGVTEVANHLDINKTSVHKILSDFCDYGYIYRNPQNSKYELGPKFIEIGNLMLNTMDIRDVATPYMEKLCIHTGETINLMDRNGCDGRYLQVIESSHSIKISVLTGTLEQLHATAAGKVILSDLKKEEIEKIITTKGLPPKTKYTITEPQKLYEVLDEVKENGYAVDNQESNIGAICIASPIYEANGRVQAAISITGLLFRTSLEELKQYLDVLNETTMKISKIYGYCD